MGKKLIITEKPSVARDFARVLKVSGNNNGYIENGEYVVSWCYGHLVQMVYPEEYDIKYKKWNLEDLPFLPQNYKYGVVESAKEQYKVVNSLLHREDIDTVYWAGDSGKEGQTIEENIRNYGGVREGMTELRVWIDSQTDDEILRGIREAKPMSDYARLGASGIMRTIEDYSLGINFSRALSVKYGRLINDAAATSGYSAIAIGRVMTCVLGMVVEREREIRNFNEDPFFKVIGKFSEGAFPAEWKAVEGSKYFESPLLYGDKGNGFKEKESAEKLIAELTNLSAKLVDKDTGISKKKAPLLFNLAELQSECSKRFKISPAQTLDIIQELYEKKYTTYPRTDARVLTTAVAKEIRKNLYGLQNYGPTANFVKDIIGNQKFVGIEKTSYTDDSKVTDHYAIIPTGQCNGIDKLSPLSQRVYDLIVRRFLSIFYPPAEYKNVKVTVQVGDEKFFAGAKVLVKPGYLEIAGIPKAKDSADNDGEDSEESEDSFSKEDFVKFVESANIGDEVSVNGFDLKEGKTSPPKRYTSGSLILAMENAGKLIEDEELREQIKTTGIGTSATRGEILEKLVRIGYLNQNNKTQVITPEKLGEMIYEVVLLTTPSLLKPEQTANWEKGLEGIINGSVEFTDYRSQLEDYIRNETKNMIDQDLTQNIAMNINQFTGKDSKGVATRKPLGIKCPKCGGELTTTSFGYGCTNYFDDNIKCKFNLGQVAGVDVPEEQFKKLVTEGKTDLIEGFKSKSGKPFKSVLKMEKNEDGEFVTSFDFSETPTEFIEGLNCPACGGRIFQTAYGFACEHRFQEENQCYFSIGEVAGRKLTVDEFSALIKEGVTPVLSGFKSKTNQKFDAKLRIKTNEEGKKVISFDFDGIEATKLEGCKCPDCGGDIAVKMSGYGCVNYSSSDENSCKFYIGKTIAGKNISPQVATQLLKEGKTDTLRGFKGKSGKKFDAVLILKKNEESGRTEVVFDFDNAEPNFVPDIVCPDCGSKIVKTNFGFACEKYFDKENKCDFVIGEIASKKLTDADVKELLSTGSTKTVRGFKGKSGKKFDACLVLKKNEESGKHEISFDFDNVEAKEIKDVACPICGGKIVVTPFGYGCSNYNKDDPDNSCKFNIGQVAGVKLKEAQVKELLSNGITDTISGFKSKKGTKFDAKLTLSKDENGKVTGIGFVFEDETKEMPGLTCPKCGSPIIKNHFGYKCKNNIQGNVDSCSFFVGKVAGVDIPEDQFTKLIKEKRTDVITGFLSKKGLFFDARLKLNDEFRTEFDFENFNGQN
ncbi:topoisomerase C-terminal repeat-containing protein [Butyrivibrio fibrisolvens]|uniref:DNA topoisomerase III n=1 Tax=Pseudobutyrivibrio ruminis TaxID=46206 RepID=UPI0003FDF483|nr:type IA DNA topoisomerase [Pseudobutyrivibrio ruminis]MDC7279620.1 topoisomerase C-terminal repeat-containing protein [Butyrivibrio fibrisolvens]